jgi:hypothetical protein
VYYLPRVCYEIIQSLFTLLIKDKLGKINEIHLLLRKLVVTYEFIKKVSYTKNRQDHYISAVSLMKIREKKWLFGLVI